MRVEVLPSHIEMGVPCVEERCPIALAIREKLIGKPRLLGVYVGCEFVTVCFSDGMEWHWMLPWEITEIIDEYDATGVIYPFGFELPLQHARMGTNLGDFSDDAHPSPSLLDLAATYLADRRSGSGTEESGEVVALHLELVP